MQGHLVAKQGHPVAMQGNLVTMQGHPVAKQGHPIDHLLELVGFSVSFLGVVIGNENYNLYACYVCALLEQLLCIYVVNYNLYAC